MKLNPSVLARIQFVFTVSFRNRATIWSIRSPPTRDGNETWIIMAAVILLAAFLVAYPILLPALYVPVIVMLLSLGFRGVSFKLRVQTIQHRRKWDLAFATGSLIAALIQSLMLGAVIQGVRVDGTRFREAFWISSNPCR